MQEACWRVSLLAALAVQRAGAAGDVTGDGHPLRSTSLNRRTGLSSILDVQCRDRARSVRSAIRADSLFWTIPKPAIASCQGCGPMEKSIYSNDYASFLCQLRDARRKAGMTQEQLATRLGQTQSFISKCERGERRLDIVEVRAICSALGTSLGDFVATFERSFTKTRR